MMTRVQYWILLVLMVVLSACDEDNTQELLPALSHNSLAMTVGEVAQITVSNAHLIEAKVGSPIISVEQKGIEILVEALSRGRTKIFVNADGHRLVCDVTIEDAIGGGDADSDKYDFSAELDDSTTRFISPELSLRYDDCGVLIVKGDQHITMVSLDMGDEIKLKYSGVLMEGADVENAQLSVNGKIVELQSARVEKMSQQGVWINMKMRTGSHIAMVVTDC